MTWRLTRRRALAVSGAACVATVLGGCGAVSPRAGLYVTGPDGAPRWIADTTGAPAWSPSGEEVAWGDERGLRIWNLSTGDISVLSERPIVGRTTWSPDGAAVAFLDSRAQVLQRVDVESGVTTPLATLHSGFEGAIRAPILSRGGPAWSPDGSRVAFVCWDGHGDELCVVDPDGSAREQVTTLGAAEEKTGGAAPSSVTSMAWSPDGAALAVAVQADVRGGVSGVFRVEMAARSGERLSKMNANSPIVWDFASNDLVFSSSVEGRSDVFRLPEDGGKALAITSALAEGAREPAVDAGVLAVVSGGQIAVLRPDADQAGYFGVPGLVSAAPSLGAGGQQLAFLALPRPIKSYP